MGRIVFGTEELFKYINEFSGFFSPNQLRHVRRYLAGLICYEGKKTIVRISCCVMLGSVSEDAIRKFLTRTHWNEKALHISRIIGLNDAIEVEIGSSKKSVGYMIIDDTTNPKRGKKMKGLGYNHSSIHDKQVWSHNVVTTHFRYKEYDYPLLADPYRHKDECRDERFQTKIELAVKQIISAPLPEGIKIYGLADSWYMCKKVIEAFKYRGIDTIGCLKNNRIVKQEGRCDWDLKTYAKFYLSKRKRKDSGFHRIAFFDEQSGRKSKAWVREDVVEISRLGKVKLLTIKRKLRDQNEDPVFIASTDTTLTAEQIMDYYHKRWTIEVFYKVGKQNLGLAQYQMRHWRGTKRHWSFVFLAYSYLSLQKMRHTHLETIGQVQQVERQNNVINLVKWQEQKRKAGYTTREIARKLAA